MSRYQRFVWALALSACTSETEGEGIAPQVGTKTGNGITLEFGTLEEGFHFAADAGSVGAFPHAFGGSPSGLTQQGWSLNVSVATMTVSRVEVLPATGVDCAALDPAESRVTCLGDRYAIAQELELDLLARESVPSLDGYRLPPGAYESVDVALVPREPSLAGPGSALRLAGVVEFGETTMPFEFQLMEAHGLAFVATTDVDVDSGATLRANLDLRTLFELNPPDCVQLAATTPGTIDTCQPSGADLIGSLRGATNLSPGP